jgi:hypothetical protein
MTSNGTIRKLNRLNRARKGRTITGKTVIIMIKPNMPKMTLSTKKLILMAIPKNNMANINPNICGILFPP